MLQATRMEGRRMEERKEGRQEGEGRKERRKFNIYDAINTEFIVETAVFIL